jgi:hypothetical protein
VPSHPASHLTLALQLRGKKKREDDLMGDGDVDRDERKRRRAKHKRIVNRNAVAFTACTCLTVRSPPGQARAAGEGRKANGHRRAAQRYQAGQGRRKQDEAGRDEGQGRSGGQQRRARQVLQIFRSFQAAGESAAPVPSLLHVFPPFSQQNEKKSGSAGSSGGAHMPVKHAGTAAAKPASAYKM